MNLELTLNANVDVLLRVVDLTGVFIGLREGVYQKRQYEVEYEMTIARIANRRNRQRAMGAVIAPAGFNKRMTDAGWWQGRLSEG